MNPVTPAEKAITPFCTCGGGGVGHIARDIAKFCIGCDVLSAVQKDREPNAERLVDQWLGQIGE